MIFVLFLISPLLALVISFRDIKSRRFYLAFLLMAVFMGLVLNIDGDGDLSRYLKYPSIWKNMEWSMVLNEKDYLFPVLSKLFSYITTNENCFGAFVFFIYTTLFLQSFKIVTACVSNQRSLWFFLSIFALFLIAPYSRIFAMRFSLASLLYLWCILEIVIKNNKRFYWVLLLVPLMHYSFLMMIILPFLHLLLKKRLTLCLIIFTISFFINSPRVSYYMNDLASIYLPQSTVNAVENYASEEGLEYMNDRDASGAQFGNARRAVLMGIQEYKTYVIMFAMVLMLVLSYKKIKKDDFLVGLFTIMLLFFALANIASSASRGDRFFDVGCTITVFVLYRISHYDNEELDLKQLVNKNKVVLSIIFVVAILYGIFYNYAMRSDYNYTLLCFGNPILAILKILGVVSL